MPIQNNPPDLDKAEISLFGPGIGECIVIHFGNGQWFIIDSCLCPETKQPIALKYLLSIGVDVATQVVGILITHWHSDHICGAFELLKQCSNAKLYQSAALSSDEAYHLVAMFKKDVFANADKEIREFCNIVEFLRKTGDRDRLDIVKASHTFFDQKGGVQTRLLALSPSALAVTQSIANLAQRIPKVNAQRMRNVVPVDENSNAVAIYFTYGDFSAVLGSDLENTQNTGTGWAAVFNDGLITRLSLSTSSVYKVSHHGSENGHHDAIWSDLLKDKPLSLTTTFLRSGLPKTEQIEKIKNLSSEFLVTRDPAAGKVIKRDRMIDREMSAVTKKRKSINDKMGHIQIRISHDGNTTVYANENCVSYV